MSSLVAELFDNLNQTDLVEQAKIVAIDRNRGRVTLAIRNGLITAGTYMYDLAKLRVGMNVLVSKVSGKYVILNLVYFDEEKKVSYALGGDYVSGSRGSGGTRRGGITTITYRRTIGEGEVPIYNCSPNAPSTIKGYAFYRNSLGEDEDSPVFVEIPNIGPVGFITSGGHCCDQAVFLPKLTFGNGRIIYGSNEINLNNAGDCGDRDDSFTFEIPNSSWYQSGMNVDLECTIPDGECHEGITNIILTLTDIEEVTRLLFVGAVFWGNPISVPILCFD